ncbi:hypothetical protein ARMSODRAFT_735185 [Armillaria solidipes]|uniref:Uncharacterized protein n=1 Tax=Armillaria solidipes TaxID=1076256 RepID=A0A2H3B8H9_9AGAR|nr:hypothetical protein ARMSODRAFT_735185 [Armillaria solidipes]
MATDKRGCFKWERPSWPQALPQDFHFSLWENCCLRQGRSLHVRLLFSFSRTYIIVLSSEDSYTLYINGKTIGTGSGWTAMQAYSIPQLDPDVNVVAVDGANARADSRVYLAAGVLMAYNDGTSETYYTDASWKTLSALPPTGFEQPDADDSEWVASTLWAGGPVGNGATVPNA